MKNLRTGIGFDVHRLVKDRDLTLGGIKIDFERGLDGHSDADVLIHALMDALLGAASMGDIGNIFPDSDPKYKNISSLSLLNEVLTNLENKSFEIINIDTTIIAQVPKLAPHIPQMKKTLLNCLKIDNECLNIKATTTEHLGFTGREEGIAALATVLLYKNP
ncbi:MAG: 2-C-methyl-D-erythritol 2,4-cyclodiphosphate synthase [Nitrospinae bacterium]|nr:2-C-methyl-D-erythritol 2,4-cyclodiphosphate synthase [Nitrospinota bacterium]